MLFIEGKIASKGIAIGRLKEFTPKGNEIECNHIDDTEKEWERFVKAQETAIHELEMLYEKAAKEVGEDNASIFEVHQMMLEDEDYTDSVKNIIETRRVNAEFAVAATGDHFALQFSSMEDDYMRGRAADVKDISERLIRILSGRQNSLPEDEKEADSGEPVIVIADDLMPSETIQLDRTKVLAFVTRLGSANSHTAILARTMNIPALVSSPLEKNIDGKMAIVDGDAGKIILEPNEATIMEYMDKLQEDQERKELLLRLKGQETVTKSGRKIKLYANVGGVSDVEDALQNDAEGIGLFRSEFLYLENQDYPTEEEQFNVYRTVAEMMNGKKAIIRTLDIGADKQVDYFNLEKEENPALGYRAIRICLERPEILITQLRALYRASAFGNISIMIPMVISVWEVKKVKEIAQEVKQQLVSQQTAIGNLEFGIMVETPAAVMLADELAEEVDFFSIGTNDLTQYTLAIDRQNSKLESFYDDHHPAVLKMIRMVADSAKKAGIWVGICGELAADTTLTEQFLEMGIDELSVAPPTLLSVRNTIRNLD